MIWIGYTTLYRDGGPKIERAARTLAREKALRSPAESVRCEPVESKRAFVDSMDRIREEGRLLSEFHFLGHSGMYGPMFGTRSLPEQFSPHEWRSLDLPFAPGGEAFLHACRTARWFAPFFARTFGVPASGYHWYTTFSTDPHRFRWERSGRRNPDESLYVVGCPGRKSHGLLGSIGKYSTLMPIEPMKRFLPASPEGDPTYDAIAETYDETFADIRVRADEWEWIEAHMPPPSPGLTVLDVGCGNGALLAALAPRIGRGAGVDTSARMIDLARRRNGGRPVLAFERIAGPTLPFPDAAFDVVISLLSFRYLDWDPIMNEMRRVLAPGGRILIIDMVAAPLPARDLPRAAGSLVRHAMQRRRHPQFVLALNRLVRDPAWQTMLRYNPIRAEHEYRWYLASRYPGRPVEVLNTRLHSRLLAFDSGPLDPGWVAPQSYP